MPFYLHLILKQKNKTSKEASSTKKKKKNFGKERWKGAKQQKKAKQRSSQP